MDSIAFRTTDDRRLEPCGVQDALAGNADSSAAHWVDVSGSDPDELGAWLAQRGIPRAAIVRMVRRERHTRVVPFGSGLALDMRVLPEADTAAPQHLSAWCAPGLLVTVDQESDVGAVSWPSGAEDLDVPVPSATGVLVALLAREAERVSREMRVLRKRILALDEQMDHDSGSIGLGEILDPKEKLHRILAIAEEQGEFFGMLSESEGEGPSEGLHVPIRLLLASAGAAERMGERLEKRVASLLARFDANQQNTVNHRLAVLTILSAVFLPLTLVAGIWGMNFESMPELGLRYGYPLALGVMAAIAGVMLILFRRKGWFD